MKGSKPQDISRIAEMVNAAPEIEGITLSGGEPLLHPRTVAALLDMLRPEKTSIVYTGYTLGEIMASRWRRRVLKRADLVIAGRYNAVLPHPYAGKQFLRRGERIDLEWFRQSHRIEYNITNHTIIRTGIHP